jgi:hypothetical protein
MRTISTNRTQYRNLGRTVAALALAAIIGSIAAVPARADDDHGRGRGHDEYRGGDRHGGRDRYQWREREWRHDHPSVYVAPGYYPYAPPPVVYAPPPVPPSLNFVFPLNLR